MKNVHVVTCNLTGEDSKSYMGETFWYKEGGNHYPSDNDFKYEQIRDIEHDILALWSMGVRGSIEFAIDPIEASFYELADDGVKRFDGQTVLQYNQKAGEYWTPAYIATFAFVP